MVETERIELSSAGCRPAVLPLNDVPMVAELGIEPTYWRLMRAVRSSSSSPHQNLVDRAGLEPATFRLSGGCTANRALGRWSPTPESNSLPRFTEAAHRQQCLRGSKLGASGANRTLVGRLPCDCSATELHRLEPKGGFEPPSERYEGSVFSNKLLRHGASNRIRTGVRTMARSNPSR